MTQQQGTTQHVVSCTPTTHMILRVDWCWRVVGAQPAEVIEHAFFENCCLQSCLTRSPTVAGRRAFQAKCSARSVTTHSQAETTVLNGRPITVIDTPGIFFFSILLGAPSATLATAILLSLYLSLTSS